MTTGDVKNTCPHCGGELPNPWDFSRMGNIKFPPVSEMAAQLLEGFSAVKRDKPEPPA